MQLRDYLTKYQISVAEFARRTGVTDRCIWHYLAGRRKPQQDTAEKIEKETDGLCTVLELRGKDDRRMAR